MTDKELEALRDTIRDAITRINNCEYYNGLLNPLQQVYTQLNNYFYNTKIKNYLDEEDSVY